MVGCLRLGYRLWAALYAIDEQSASLCLPLGPCSSDLDLATSAMPATPHLPSLPANLLRFQLLDSCYVIFCCCSMILRQLRSAPAKLSCTAIEVSAAVKLLHDSSLTLQSPCKAVEVSAGWQLLHVQCSKGLCQDSALTQEPILSSSCERAGHTAAVTWQVLQL